ncbi:PHD finger protein 3, partial [Araneus ventricosus]
SISKAPEISSISKAPDISSISKAPDISSILKVPEISSISEVPEISSISPPIRRSKRQIEKLERELVAAANVDVLDHEVPKEKLVKHEEKKSDDKDTKSLKIETNLNSDIKVSNYKSFAEFKKRHLKVMIEDCRNMKNEDESVPIVSSNSTEEILHDSMDNKCKNDSAVEDKDIQNLKQPEPQAKSKYLRKTKVHKPADVESDEKSNIHSPHVKKRKYLNLIPNSNNSSPKKSSECEEKSDKSGNKNVLKEKKKTIEHIKQKNLTHIGKKRKKHASSSEKLPSNSEVHQVADSPVSKRKKCVSFSEDLLSSDKPEAIPRKQRISSDCKESHQKTAVSSPVISTTPVSKVHKKKILRRDSLRLINDDGPALFSQPDVMIKVSVDDNANKKDEKESDFSDRQNKVKTADMPAVKNSLKENHEMKEKQMLKDKSESNKLSLKTKQEKEEVIKVMQEEKEKETAKLKQDDKGKQALKQEDKGKQGEKEKQALKEDDKEKQVLKEENKEKYALKQEDKEKELKQDKQDLKVKNEEEERQKGEKERLILNQEEKEKQMLKQDESKVNQKENQILKAIEEPTEEHLEEKHAEEYQEEKHKDREKHNEEKSECNDENSYDHQMDCSDNLQYTEREFDQQKEMQHSYNNFTNIEAFLESSKFHAAVQEVEGNASKDSKCISQSTAETSEKVGDKKCSPKGTLKHDDDENLVESISNTESDSQILSLTGINEEPKLIPERKSRRLIKKKEFFGDTSDSSDSKKVSAAKNKRTNLDKPTGRGRRSSVKNKNISKNGELNGRNGHLEEDISTDPDSSEEDDPKKLWCICRKPHNSRFMIQCDKCEDWFHGSCVGVTKQYGRQLEKQKKEWNCPNCRLKGESSPQKAEKSLKQAADIGSPNEKNSKTDERDEHENRKKPLFQDVNMLNSTNFENNKMPTSDVKNFHSSALEQLPSDDISLKKEKAHSNIVEKSDKISKVRISKQPSQQKPSAAFKQNLSSNLKIPDDALKLSKQSSLTNAKSDVSLKSPVLPKQPLSNSQNASPNKKTSTVKVVSRVSGKSTSVFLDPKRKLSNALKEKDELIKKKQSCVNCQSEARSNSCYCSDECIEKYAALFLKTLPNKGNLKGHEFDSQRLVVLNRFNGNLINENGPTAGEIVSWLKSNPTFIITGSSNTSSSTKKDASSLKKEAESNSSSERKDSTDESAKTTIRLNVRKTLKNILLERCKKADDLEMSEEDVQKIAVKIEEELNALFKDNSFKYRAKYRSLMFNIKDPRNQGLFRKILKGNIPPDRLVRMTPEELASMELAKWREQENQHLLDMIKRVQLEQQKSGSGLLLKKTHKGEVEIEDDLTSIIEVSSDGFLSNMMSRDQPYAQRILGISLPHRFLPQNVRKCMKRGYQETPHFCLEDA